MVEPGNTNETAVIIDSLALRVAKLAVECAEWRARAVILEQQLRQIQEADDDTVR